MSTEKKTIIHVWTHVLSNHTVTDRSNRFGLGDLLRGSIGVLQYCEKNNYECIIDISLHPIAQLLQIKKHKYSDFIEQNKNMIKGIFSTNINNSENIYTYMDNELKEKDMIFFFSNFGLDVFNKAPSKNILEKIHDLLEPNHLFKDYSEKMLLKLPFSDYTILHFRLGDDDLIRETNTLDYQIYLKKIIDTKDTNQILLSDSKKFKDIVKASESIFMYDEPLAHLGFHTNAEKIKHTLFEFMLLTKAGRIHSLSVYWWKSGFAHLANYLYNVPVIPF